MAGHEAGRVIVQRDRRRGRVGRRDNNGAVGGEEIGGETMAEHLGNGMMTTQLVGPEREELGDNGGAVEDEEGGAEGEELVAGGIAPPLAADGVSLHSSPSLRSGVATVEHDKDPAGIMDGMHRLGTEIRRITEGAHKGEDETLEDLHGGVGAVVKEIAGLALVAAEIDHKTIDDEGSEGGSHLRHAGDHSALLSTAATLDQIGVEAEASGEEGRTQCAIIVGGFGVALLVGREAVDAHISKGGSDHRLVVGRTGRETVGQGAAAGIMQGGAGTGLRHEPPLRLLAANLVLGALSVVLRLGIAAVAEADMTTGIGTCPGGATADSTGAAGAALTLSFRLAGITEGEIGEVLRESEQGLAEQITLIGLGVALTEPGTAGDPDRLTDFLRRGEGQRSRKGGREKVMSKGERKGREEQGKGRAGGNLPGCRP